LQASRATDERVLDAALRVMNAGSWAEATLERIAREAGVSRVTLHRRGLGKEEILGRLAAQGVVRYREAMWPILTGPGTGAERLLGALEALCGLAEENLHLLLALDAAASATVFHEPTDEDALTRNEFTEPLERVLRDGATDGTLRSVDAAETATVLFNLVGWTYIHLRSGHRWSAERASAATLSVVLPGLAST